MNTEGKKRTSRFLSKWKGKLAVQLGILILGMNLLVLILCFTFLYLRIEDILLEKAEKDNIERLEQSEYNIDVFYEQVKLALRRLAINSDLKTLSKDMRLSEGDRYYCVNQVLESFDEIQENYPYIQQISFFGENGIVIKKANGTGPGRYFVMDTDKSDWYYTSELARLLEIRKQLWYGGCTARNFSFAYREELDGKDEYYVSFAQVVVYGAGALVINVDMDYFLDLFYVNAVENSETMYTMDENCRVVAARDFESVGTTVQFSGGEEIQDGVERYIEDTQQGKTQIITYALPAMGWKLVSEMPVAEVTKESRHLKDIMILACALSVTASFVLTMWCVSKMLKPLKELAAVVRKVGTGKLGRTFEKIPGNELGVLTMQFNQMSLDLRELFQQKEHMERERRELEMQTLRAQINPHLIYNTLNAIKWRALISEERNIAESISLLSDFLEPVFKNQKLLCTVREELDYVKNYIAIMNLLKTGVYLLETEVPEACCEYPVIRFLLQPVVENAILHGFRGASSGKICISMEAAGADALLRVTDNGCGMNQTELQKLQEKLRAPELWEGEGVGLVNVARRIRNQYGTNYGISVCNGEKSGMVVVLRIKWDM